MHHHHALALLVFSIVFAAFALFTLCTLAPKAHASSVVNNPGREDTSVSALAGLPIRRRSVKDSLFVRDGLLATSRGNEDALSSIVSLHSSQEANDEQEDALYKHCTQHLKFVDPSLQLQAATTASQSSEGSIWDSLISAVNFLGRDNYTKILPSVCVEYWQRSSSSDERKRIDRASEGNGTLTTDKNRESETEEKERDNNAEETKPQHMGIYLDITPSKREVVEDEKEKRPVHSDGRSGVRVKTVVSGQPNVPSDGNIPVGHSSPILQDVKDKDETIMRKRDDASLDLLGPPSHFDNKRRVKIDFQKAERDAHLAGLADGFIIETEYLTPGRKVVQHNAKKPNTRTVKLHFEGDNLVLDDPLKANSANPTDAQGIMDNVLAMHDQQQLDPYFNQYAQPGPQTSTLSYQPSLSNLQQPVHRRYDLVKRDESPVRRSFRFDRRA